MTDLVNHLRFEEGNKLTGNIACMAYDLDIFGEPFESANPKAPVYLRALIQRGREGSLYLSRSLFALSAGTRTFQ